LEIEHTITEAGEEALRAESVFFELRLRETAIKEALTSRGKPVEVTASDVKRAVREVLTFREAASGAFSQTYNKLFLGYFWLGIAMAALSLVFFVFRSFEIDLYLPFPQRTVGLVGLSGIFLAALSAFMRWYVGRKLCR
jgi:hypothetical protein